jgi:catechol 2,3-dioxygenase-like lactoylglutathione lyase family enzyme
MTSNNVRPRLQSMTPLLVVSDLQRAIDFYQRRLGFADPSVWGEPPCFAMLTRDGFELMLSLAEDPAHARPNGASGVWEIYLRVADVAAEMAALKSAGVPIDKGPTVQLYEMREIEIVDPDGHRICVAEDIGAGGLKAAEEWEGVLDIGSAKLRLVLKIATAGGVSKAALDSLDQGAMNLPVEQVERDGKTLRFEMIEIGAKFEGVVSADGREIAGEWSQRGRTWPLLWRCQS